MTLDTSTVTIPLEAGASTLAYRTQPVGRVSAAYVIVLAEIWGVNTNIRTLCKRLAQAGFCALAPDLYRGAAAPVESDPAGAIAQSFLDFDDPRGIRDCRAVVRWAKAGDAGGAPIFVWGFCMGGRFAHYAGAYCEGLAGVVNFYGRLVFERRPTKPFLPMEVAELIEVPYLGLFGEHDPIVPALDVEALRDRFARRGLPHRLQIFRGAEHAFFNETRPSYHPQAAREAWDIATAFFRTGKPD
jgi:carboxymethylenebutenolidase